MVITAETPVAWPYPVGNQGTPWTEKEKAEWRTHVDHIKRSYKEEVVERLQSIMVSPTEPEQDLSKDFDLINYGSLSQNPNRYPLYLVKSKVWDATKPSVLVTGGVHGYETSGVQGALLFIKEGLKLYTDKFNFVVAPCISPWGYETIQRWNINAVDVNRSFIEKNEKSAAEDSEKGRGEGRTEESAQIMDWIDDNIENGRTQFKIHIDLHETTDSDATEFRAAKHARGGQIYDRDAPDNKIPIGFYLVGNADSKHETRSPFCRAIIRRVAKVTKICEDRDIIGFPCETEDGKIGGQGKAIGVLYVGAKSLALCAGQTSAELAVTTEVYPDAQGVTSEECDKAQLHVVLGALEYYQGNCM